MIHLIFFFSSFLSCDTLSVCLSHISHSTLYPFWFLASHTLSPITSCTTHPLHLSGSVSAHLHVTTCIEFSFSAGRALRVVSLQLFPLLATYINIYLILFLVCRVYAVSYFFHGLALCWRFLALRVCLQINRSPALGVVSNILLICFSFMLGHFYCSIVPWIPGAVRVYQSSTFEFEDLRV
jgi:hypothetical protein